MKRFLFLATVVTLSACDASPTSNIPTTEDDVGSASAEAPAKPQHWEKNFIITLQPKVNANDVARDHGLSPNTVYTHVLNGFSGHISEVARSGLMKDYRVLRVEEDMEVHLFGEQISPPWGLDRIDQRSNALDGVYASDLTGAGVTVYIVDTGIHYSHEEFEGRAHQGYSYFFGDGSDCHGHGTHVAGTVGGKTFGVAKEADLVSVDVLTCSGSGTLEGVIAGLDWVAANAQHPAVVNMSLGGGASETLDEAVRNLVAAGITVAVAAGNSYGDACSASPAREPVALTVGATDSSDRRAVWSNWGTCVDWFAPGVGIESASHLDDLSSVFMSGTSMATPHTAGVAALFLQSHPDATPSEVAEALRAGTTRGVVVDAQSPAADLLSSELSVGESVNQSPIADFSLTCTARSCAFQDLSSDPDGAIVAWRWNFGDGTESAEQSPTHIFAEDGSYTVELLVTDDQGSEKSHSRVVSVSTGSSNQPPVASFTADCQDLQCTFIDGSSDPDGTIVQWFWDYGDGNSLTSQSSSHEFSQAGTYTVSLEVADNGGETGRATREVTVTVPNAPPSADFGLFCEGLVCQFTDGSTDQEGQITSWQWNFGDGNTSMEMNPSHPYGVPGTYNVSLTVTDNAGATGSIQRSITVEAASGIFLTAVPYKVKGAHQVDLTWSGATGTKVEIYKDDAPLALVPNTGSFTDMMTNRDRGEYVYQVCEVGTGVCSLPVLVSCK